MWSGRILCSAPAAISEALVRLGRPARSSSLLEALVGPGVEDKRDCPRDCPASLNPMLVAGTTVMMLLLDRPTWLMLGYLLWRT